MRRIYRFDTINNYSITVDEAQSEPDKVTLRVHTNEDMFVLHFDKTEFEELCRLPFRLDHPAIATPAQTLALMAA